MARHLVWSLWLAAIAVALALQGCGKRSPASLDRPPHAATGRAAAADPTASRPEALHGSKTSERSLAASARPLEQYPTEDSPPWLAELLHAPDPNVRIQALDAWARQPGPSLDPVTYALVDPDETVRARAQEVLERELARR
jgi:HEAT repeat protein